MPILSASNLRYTVGDRVILEDASLAVEPGERVGVVGRNGTGKSTLLKIMSGRLRPDSGSVTLQRNCRAGYLAQEPELDRSRTLREEAGTAFVELTALHDELHAVFNAMGGAEGGALERLLARQGELERRITAAGGFAIDHKIDAVLHGLGFEDSQFAVPVPGLSGGQRARLALAKLLLESPDVILLDEPTNHLDIDGRLWLESFLRDQFRGAVVLISHDRRLLDNVVSRIEEVEQGRLIDYPGNYAKFRELRAERRLAMLRAYERQQTKFRQEEAYIRRYKAGQRAKQARGRQTRLDRERAEESLERPLELESFRIQLPKAARSGDIVASARGISKAYTNNDSSRKILFHSLDVSIARGERWGIIGPNGAGKTTLVRCLLGETALDAGEARVGSAVSVGYFRQSHEGVDPEKTVCRYLQDVIRKESPAQALSEQQARDLAGAFLFSGEDQDKQLGVLSGGERARAMLAGLLASAKNVLVLDEPTNHLDIPSAERLEEALAGEGGFEGTVLLISHDRALIDGTCDHLLALDGRGGAEVFVGNYSEWIARKASVAAANAPAPTREARPSRKEEAPPPAPADDGAPPRPRARSKHSWMKLEQIEARLGELQGQAAKLDAELAEPEVWTNVDRSRRLTEERATLGAEIAALEEEWLRRIA